MLMTSSTLIVVSLIRLDVPHLVPAWYGQWSPGEVSTINQRKQRWRDDSHAHGAHPTLCLRVRLLAREVFGFANEVCNTLWGVAQYCAAPLPCVLGVPRGVLHFLLPQSLHGCSCPECDPLSVKTCLVPSVASNVRRASAKKRA